MPDTEPETGTTEPPASQQAPASVETAEPADGRLPDDHPLVKAYAATKSDLAEAHSKLKSFEDAQKSEAEKLADERAAEQARADKAEAEAARLRAAVKYGLSDGDLDLLGTGTAEEIDDRAKRLAERIGAQSGPRRPTPDPSQGTRDQNPSGSTADQFAAALGGLL